MGKEKMRLKIALAALLLWLSPLSFALSYNANYYAVYEAPIAGGGSYIYIVPKLSILIVASDVDIPVAFMPKVPGIRAILAADGSLGAFTTVNLTAKDMAAYNATLSSYKVFGGDFNADGQRDLLLQGTGSRESIILTADANGNPSLYYNFKTQLSGAQISVRDVDGNGRADVIAAIGGTGQTYLGNEANGFDSVDQTINSTSLVGSIAGKFRVDEQGEATYSVAILAAPGTAGVTPQISLNYSSSGGEGIAGVGWSLGGLSTITRCRQTLSQDNNAGNISLTNTDRFCLDGQRLILASGSYGAPNSTYRTEIDSYAVITAVGGSAGNPDSFTVVRKDGSVSTFGDGNNSAQGATPGNALHLSWAISLFKDSVGNPIKFTYLDDASGHRVSRIDYAYGANTTASGPSGSYIEFLYQDRPDKRRGYVVGYELARTVRLSGIRSVSENVELRTYQLQYMNSASAHNRSYLEKLYECASGNCMAPTSFTWVVPDGGVQLAGASDTWYTVASSQQIQMRTMDINGDGRADLLSLSPTYPYTIYYQISTGTGFQASQPLPQQLAADLGDVFVLDMNNDGMQDLLTGAGVFWGGPGGLSASPSPGAYSLGSAYSALADINSDGLPDFIFMSLSDNSLHYRLLQRGASGFEFGETKNPAVDLAPFRSSLGAYCNTSPPLLDTLRPNGIMDYNGDGLIDITVAYRFICGSGGIIPGEGPAINWLPTILRADANGTSFTALAGFTDGLFFGPESRLADVNGDGLADQLRPYSVWQLSINTGKGFATPVSLFSTAANLNDPSISLRNAKLQVADVNADGYPDVVYPSGGNLVVRYYDPWNQSYGAENAIVAFNEANDGFLFADMDGDGHLDLVHMAKSGGNYNINVYKSRDINRATNRIAKIDNGLGNITNINYKPLTDSLVYTRATDANALTWPDGTARPYPVFDMMSPDYVVSSVSSSAPAGSDNSPGSVNYAATSGIDYRYSGAKMQASGRGFLGFASIETTDPQSGVVTTTTYHQDFPLIGQPITTQVKTGNLIFKSSVNHTAARTVTGADNTHYYQIYVDRVEETNRDPLTGAETGFVVTTVDGIDTWGNITANSSSTFAAGDHVNCFAQVKTNNEYGATGYDQQFGRLSKTTATHRRGSCSPSSGDVTRVSSFTYYDSGALKGLLHTETVEPDYDNIATTYSYDIFGNKIRKEVSAGGVTRYSGTYYDNAGRYVTRTTGPVLSGGTWSEQDMEVVDARNAYGAPLQVHSPLSASSGGMTRYFSYDSLGRESMRWDSTGAQVTTGYGRGFLPSGAQYRVVTSANNGATTTEYFDMLGRSISKVRAGFDGRLVATETEYDKFGRVLRQSQPHFSNTLADSWVEFRNDKFGRPQSQAVPASQSESNGALAATNITYDGLYTKTTNAAGQIREEWRNPMGEVILVKDASESTVAFEYDATGQLIHNAQGDAAVAVSHIRLSYDRLGRKIKMIDSDKGVWFYEYNGFGDLINQYKVMSTYNYAGTLADALAGGAQMQRTHMEYDLRGRMVARVDSLEDGSRESTALWVYDTAGRGLLAQECSGAGSLTDCASGSVRTNYSYDGLGRAVGTTTTIDGIPYVQSVTYDAIGRVATQLDGVTSSSGVRNTYNAQGYLQIVSDLDSPATPLYQVQDMDARGNVISAAVGGTSSSWSYEEKTGLLLSQSVAVGANKLQDLRYTWDILGNQKSRRDKGLVSVTSGAYRNLRQGFCYDNLNRLTKTIQGETGTCAFDAQSEYQQYDELGNITNKSGVAYTYTSQRPHAVAATSDGATYTYDNVGNLVGDNTGRTLHYSVFDKPTQISKYDNQITFQYGPDRMLFKRIDTDTSGNQSTVTTSVGNIEKVVKPDGSYDVRRYIGGVGLWIYHYSSNGTQMGLDKQYLHRDILGSVALITDQLGNIEQQEGFNAWGERVDVSDWKTVLPDNTFLPISNQFTNKGFTGHEMLDAVGLIHMQGRIYDPKLGRFAQADPFVQDSKDTQAYNRYTYVRNNPLTLTDPSGFSWLRNFARAAWRWSDPVASHLHEHTGEIWLKHSESFREAVGMVMGILDSTVCMGICSAAYNGYVTDLMGGSAWQGLAAAAFSYAAYAGANWIGNTWGFAEHTYANVIASGILGGTLAEIQGGSFGNGFVSAGLGSYAGGAMSSYWGGTSTAAVFARIAAGAVVGGTVSQLTGGKFANGAAYGAFGAALRELMAPAEPGVSVSAATDPDAVVFAGKPPPSSDVLASAQAVDIAIANAEEIKIESNEFSVSISDQDEAKYDYGSNSKSKCYTGVLCLHTHPKQRYSGPFAGYQAQSHRLGFGPDDWVIVQKGTPNFMINFDRDMFVLEYISGKGYVYRFIANVPYKGK